MYSVCVKNQSSVRDMADVRIRSRAASYLARCVERLQKNIGSVHIAVEREDVMHWWDRFKNAHHAVCNITQDAEGNSKNMELYDSVKSSYGKCLQLLEQTLPPGPGSICPDATHIQIEPITLLTFKGEPMKWLEFRDQFVALVHNSNIDSNHKLALLRKYAQVDMVSLAYTGNYEELWNRLCDRYDDNHSLAKAWTSRWMCICPVTDTREGLMSLVDETRALIRAFNLMDRDISDSAPMYCMLLTKLPEAARDAWGFSLVDTSIPTIEMCLRFIEKRFKAISGTEVIKVPPGSTNLQHSAAVLIPHKSRCACSDDHDKFYLCPAFNRMNRNSRAEFISGRGQCLNCFGYHDLAACLSTRNCNHCQLRHHQLLCLNMDPAPGSNVHTSPRQ